MAMTPIRLPAAAVLAAALLLSSACGAQDDSGGTASSPEPTEPQSELIEYTEKPEESVGVAITKVADVDKLKGAPDDFKQFIAGIIAAQVGMGTQDEDCPFTVGVDKIDTSGFAVGSMTSCGGAAFIWAKRDGLWQQIWGGQDIPACSDLTKFSVPTAIIGDKCYDERNNKVVEYTG